MKRPRTEWKDLQGESDGKDVSKQPTNMFPPSSKEKFSSKMLTQFPASSVHYSGFLMATSTSIPSSSKDPIAKKAPREALRNAVAGAMAGIFSRTITAPIDRVKLMLQLQTASPSMHSSASQTSKSTRVHNSRINLSAWKVCRQIYSTEGGIRAFWRGNGPNVIRQGGASALNFMFMDHYKTLILPIMNATLVLPSNRSHETREKRRKILSSFLSGGLAGGTTTTFLYPFEFMRTRLALDVGSSRMYPRGMR